MRVRSGYSFRTAYGHLPDVVSRVQEIGWDFLPISDRMSTFGFNRGTKAAAKAGLRPIYGVEIPCVPELGASKPVTDMWTFFAQSNIRALHDLVWKATNNPGKEPSLLYKQALAAEGVVTVAGERLLVAELPETLPTGFYMGLSPATPMGLYRRAIARGVPLLATSDNFYPREDDLEFYRVALGRRAGTQTYPRHIMSDDELSEWLVKARFDPEEVDRAFRNRDAAVSKCNAVLKRAKLLVPEKAKPLRVMCEEGAKLRGIDLSDEVYSARLDRELTLIKEKDFEDYFYIIADMIAWAKARMVVGPARGSSCGSLVCYLLNITAIDPIPYGLMFERFIDINRKDLPDIDIDFSDVRRPMVFDYAEERYGKERVARLGTVGMFKAKSALNQAGMALHIPKWRTEKVSDSIIERSSADSRAMNSLEDTLRETDAGRSILHEYPEVIVAAKLEGHPNVSSQHAAGVVITDDPIAEFVALDARSKAIWCDKKDAEDLNLLKIDALGLTQLSIFERTMELIGEKPVSGWLEKIPLDDPAAFDILNRQQYSGVFQFVGAALRSVASQIHFDKLDDLVAVTALARPGPLASGGTGSWVKRKNGVELIPPMHPLLEELTRDTYGVVIYQETVMKITREIGRMSWENVSTLRKAMSGSMGDEYFEAQWNNFKVGAIENGMDELTARAIWEQINTFGSWSFNKSHAVAYGMISYWCCWLKAHHPVEFAAATLDAEPDPGKQISILRELHREGVEYVAVDPERSVDRWTQAVRDGKTILVGPLTAIKGIGPAKLREILDARKAGTEIRPTLMKQLVNAKTEIDTLFPIRDAVKRLHPDLAEINIFSDPTDAVDVQPGVRGQVMIFGLAVRIAPRDENDNQNVTKRGGRRLSGPTQAMNMFFRDDSDEIFCKINRFDYDRIAPAILDKGKAGKSLFAIKGTVPNNFRMIEVKAVRYLGEIAE